MKKDMEPAVETMDTATLCAQAGKDFPAETRIRAMSMLCVTAKKAAGRREIENAEGIHDALADALSAEEPKLRKNAARLMGALGNPCDAAPLGRALGQETTRFVVPSILLALGSIGREEALATVRAYEVPQSTAPEEEKHCAEIAEAYQKAMSLLEPREVPMIHSLNAPRTVLLVHPQGFTDVLLQELAGAGIPAKAVSAGVMVKVQDLDKLYKIRTFFEALLPCSVTRLDAAEIAAAARTGWGCFSLADAAGCPALPYRVEMKDAGDDRLPLIHAVTAAVGGTNDPSHYSFEIRVRCLTDGRAAVYVKPCTVRDVRFNYRLGKLPASIHPVTAAAIARAAVEMLGQGEKTLRAYDPCCGSGTMLVEEAKAHAGRSVLMGTDISQEAVRIAEGNLSAACCHGTVLRKDCVRFEARNPFDLVISNLPFGNRVGTHESITPVYHGLVRKLPALVRPGGLAVLYTMEGKLLEKEIASARLRVEKVVRTDAGGLFPRAYFIRF